MPFCPGKGIENRRNGVFQLFFVDVFYIEIDQGKADNREYKIELGTEEYNPLFQGGFYKIGRVFKGYRGQTRQKTDQDTHNLSEGFMRNMPIAPFVNPGQYTAVMRTLTHTP